MIDNKKLYVFNVCNLMSLELVFTCETIAKINTVSIEFI